MSLLSTSLKSREHQFSGYLHFVNIDDERLNLIFEEKYTVFDVSRRSDSVIILAADNKGKIIKHDDIHNINRIYQTKIKVKKLLYSSKDDVIFVVDKKGKLYGIDDDGKTQILYIGGKCKDMIYAKRGEYLLLIKSHTIQTVYILDNTDEYLRMDTHPLWYHKYLLNPLFFTEKYMKLNKEYNSPSELAAHLKNYVLPFLHPASPYITKIYPEYFVDNKHNMYRYRYGKDTTTRVRGTLKSVMIETAFPAHNEKMFSKLGKDMKYGMGIFYTIKDGTALAVNENDLSSYRLWIDTGHKLYRTPIDYEPKRKHINIKAISGDEFLLEENVIYYHPYKEKEELDTMEIDQGDSLYREETYIFTSKYGKVRYVDEGFVVTRKKIE